MEDKTTPMIRVYAATAGTLCPLCNAVNESHAHLFFSCGFSKTVWGNLKPLCKLDDISDVWAEIVSGISVRNANNSLWSIIQRLVFGVAVYYIWQERNIRLFQQNFRSEESVFKITIDTIRHKLLSLKINRSVESEKAAAIWKIPLRRHNSCFNVFLVSANLLIIVIVGFVMGTGLWDCNQVFDRGDCGLSKLLCTTEARIASCAGHQFVVLGGGWLCTTGTDSFFYAGVEALWIDHRLSSCVSLLLAGRLDQVHEVKAFEYQKTVKSLQPQELAHQEQYRKVVMVV
ncbi:reverse transcriptase zinc-binding domain-containing protein [Artemisia annua]|uniref:Reverse transcriptase zinc-binding domain-containing protein n=1 Tax=Artemisia annua TaxID=35608 RepID=A0A2U1N7J9_ARTAN|nr:reverse transcriptase zinc-binding domain-containing protein [Artemisia annua]